jgi:single stranded DNA-binding protein
MYTMNQLTIIGFTGNDAEAHYTPNGTLVVTISVATKESWRDADGKWQSRTYWHRIVSFGGQAEFTRTLTKGLYVMVQCARASTNGMARSTASSKFALTRSASSTARNVALKPKASLTRAMPE